eukprot:3807818-Amphidinium_carterae.1
MATLDLAAPGVYPVNSCELCYQQSWVLSCDFCADNIHKYLFHMIQTVAIVFVCNGELRETNQSGRMVYCGGPARGVDEVGLPDRVDLIEAKRLPSPSSIQATQDANCTSGYALSSSCCEAQILEHHRFRHAGMFGGNARITIVTA